MYNSVARIKSRLKGSLSNDRRLTRVIRPRTFYSAKIKSTETHAWNVFSHIHMLVLYAFAFKLLFIVRPY